MSKELLDDERELILHRLGQLDCKMTTKLTMLDSEVSRQFLQIETRLTDVEQFAKSAGRTAGLKSGALSTSLAGIVMLVAEVIRQIQ
jgi:tetrahydromethanopterin S-methyltransferase subunit F